MKFSNLIRRMSYTALALGLLSYGSTAQAGLMDLSDMPLFLSSTNVPANILFMVDDSGSMDWEVMTKHLDNDGIFSTNQPDGRNPLDAGPIKHRDDNDDGAPDCALAKGGQTFNGYIYTTKMPNNAYGGGGGQNCNIVDDRAWRFRNSDYNPLYFDPKRTYKPWNGFDDRGIPFGNMPITAAREDPFDAGSPTVDLTRRNSKLRYSDHNKDGQPDGFYYYTWTDLDGDGNFDNGEETEHLIQDADPATQQNFANWFSYYRSREYVTKAAFGEVLANLSDEFRAGLITIRNNAGANMQIDQVTSDPASGHKRDLLDSLYKIRAAGGTPMRSAMDQAGDYFKCLGGGGLGFPDCPILPAEEGGKCQQNYLVMMTDGFYSDSYKKAGNTDGPGNGNTEWDGGAYADDWSDTLGDIAMEFYENDLQPNMEDLVPTIIGVDEARHQHVVTYSIAFGVNGTIDEDPLDETAPFAWPDPESSNRAKIDDLRHAAFNGRGDFLRADQPEELVSVLRETLDRITERTTSAASVALNSGSFNDDSKLYQARFVSGLWSGHLLAYPLDATGAVGAVAWDAGQLLDQQDWDTGRHILTYDEASGQGVPFRWANFNPEMQKLLNLDSMGVDDGQGAARTEFLRGNRTLEDSVFRKRMQVLGDLVNSNPTFVGDGDFPNGALAREHVIYVGGNDGMLHAFSAATGKELLAYVPRSVFHNLSQLTKPQYTHRFYVDGSPAVADAFGFSNRCSGMCWHTTLVGSLRNGGQAVFALDVTNPSSFSESAAQKLVSWEFTDADDPDLGYTYGTPGIVKMAGDRWAVVMGNGYNNTLADGNASTTGQAALFVLFLEPGAYGGWTWTPGVNYIKIPVGVGDPTTPNGLSTPFMVDLDDDLDVEFAYAGDLRGNMWKFDLRDADPKNWTATSLFVATSGDGSPQPITSQPVVGRHPEGGVMVYFGTGKYIEHNDHVTDGAQAQTLYGIRDTLTTPTEKVLRSALFAHTIQESGNVRSITTTLAQDQCASQYSGWYANLPTAGERNVADPILRAQRIVFTSMIPSTKPCSFGGDSWLMQFDAVCGNGLDDPPFELTDADKVGDNPLIGKKSNVGIVSTPAILYDKKKGKAHYYLSGSSGDIDDPKDDESKALGRIAWQQYK